MQCFRTHSTWSGIALTLFALAAGGCVQRTIHITSHPTGALVRLNDQEVGRTPITVPFTFYGTYDVRLTKEGYQPLRTKKKTDEPFWEYPGPDLLAEMIPGVKVREDWHFNLTQAMPPSKVDADILLDHAKQLRATAEQSPK